MYQFRCFYRESCGLSLTFCAGLQSQNRTMHTAMLTWVLESITRKWLTLNQNSKLKCTKQTYTCCFSSHNVLRYSTTVPLHAHNAVDHTAIDHCSSYYGQASSLLNCFSSVCTTISHHFSQDCTSNIHTQWLLSSYRMHYSLDSELNCVALASILTSPCALT
jgi:hypothetical protein